MWRAAHSLRKGKLLFMRNSLLCQLKLECVDPQTPYLPCEITAVSTRALKFAFRLFFFILLHFSHLQCYSSSCVLPARHSVCGEQFLLCHPHTTANRPCRPFFTVPPNRMRNVAQYMMQNGKRKKKCRIGRGGGLKLVGHNDCRSSLSTVACIYCCCSYCSAQYCIGKKNHFYVEVG